MNCSIVIESAEEERCELIEFQSKVRSAFLEGYYEKVAQLVDLGIFDLEVGNVEKINADIIDKFYENESTEKRTGKRNIKKFSGAVTAEYFRSKIEEILSRYPKYKISDNNVYIPRGCRF